MGFGDIRIPAKLTLVFAALVLTIVATGAVAHVNASAHERSVARMAEAHRAMLAASRVEFGLIRQENSLRGFLLSGDPYYLRRIAGTHAPAFETALSDLRAAGAGSRADAIAAAYADYRRTVIEPIARLEQDPTGRQAAFALVKPDGQADDAIKPAEAAVDRATAEAAARIRAETEVQAKAAALLRVTLVVGAATTLLLTVLAGWWLSRVIARPVVSLARAMDRVRDGEGLEALSRPPGRDEIGRLTTAFNEMVADLKWHDASLRRAMEDLSRARDAAETSDQLKSQFLANMSHEIRTPLNGVLGMIQAMQLERMDPAQAERAALARQSAEALLAVIDDILELAKIEAGKAELRLAPLNLRDLLDGVAAMHAPAAETQGLALSVRVDEAVEGAWIGDATLLTRVVGALTSNAVKFTPQGRVCLKATAADGGVRISVTDTGIGIPAERQDALFRKFTQIDGAATRRFGGVGLGLAICRELTGLMGGVVSVQSAPGEGSCFTLDLPLTRQAALRAA
jgi:signal transduction histidine kinase